LNSTECYAHGVIKHFPIPRLRRSSLAILLLVGVATTASGQSVSTDPADSEIADFLASFVSTFNNLEWERFRALFTDDATVFFPGGYRGRRAEGRAEVEAAFRDVFARWRARSSGPPYLHIRPLDVHVQRYGEVAVVTFHLEEEEGLNRRTLVLRHVTGEGWRIAHLHASSR